MPAATSSATTSKEERSEQTWTALKDHILKERKRKKQEQEAEVEEERLRKEREARERQDVMTLGETREQIQQLEQKLSQLKDEKHQLFLQLKKVLNEDDNRRRQLHKENNEMLMHTLPMVQSQLFLPPVGGPSTARPPQHIMGQPQPHIHKTSQQVVGGAIKRGRSPSPNAYYKQSNSYPPPKLEEGRRGGEVARAVLWNKPSQYSNGTPGTPFYQVPQPVSNDNRNPGIMYPSYAPVITQQSHIRQGQNYHLELKPEPERKMPPQERSGYPDKNIGSHAITMTGVPPPEAMGYGPGIRQGQIPIHNPGMTLQNATQNPKTGSITSGYPIRPTNAPLQNPAIYARHRY